MIRELFFSLIAMLPNSELMLSIACFRLLASRNLSMTVCTNSSGVSRRMPAAPDTAGRTGSVSFVTNFAKGSSLPISIFVCSASTCCGCAAPFDRQTATIKKHKAIITTYLDSIMLVFFLSVDDINSDGHLAFQVNSALIVGIDSDRIDTHLFGAVLEFIHQSHNVPIAARNA